MASCVLAQKLNVLTKLRIRATYNLCPHAIYITTLKIYNFYSEYRNKWKGECVKLVLDFVINIHYPVVNIMVNLYHSWVILKCYRVFEELYNGLTTMEKWYFLRWINRLLKAYQTNNDICTVPSLIFVS